MKIGMSLVGRIENNITLGGGKFLIPLFEAISNSIHAIDDAQEPDGCITVKIHRDTSAVQQLLDGTRALPPISGFSIEDNGVGFTKKNFDSFCTADSLYKKTRGGKGVGRFYWLKAFREIHVTSVYQEDDKWHERQFDFVLTEDPIKPKPAIEVACGPRKTVVELLNCFPQFKKEDNAVKLYDTVGRKIIEHFVTYFVQNTCPEILLSDPHTGTEAVSLNRMFTHELRLEDEPGTFDVGGETFTIHKLRIRTTAHRPPHSLHLCAQGRSVEEVSLVDHIPALSGALIDSDRAKFCYAGYVSGLTLDSAVSQDRTRFELPDRKGFYSEVALHELIEKASEVSEQFLEPYLAPLREQQVERVKTYAESNPRYRPLVRLRPAWVHAIRTDVKDEELDLELYKLSQRLELEVRSEGAALKSEVEIETNGQPVKSVATRTQSLKRYLDDSNAISIAKLAEYVIQRRATLDFLADCMKIQSDGKFAKEDIVHELIFPMRTTSDTVADPDQNNLWLIDERLSYHMYLASDLQFSQIDQLQDESSERMDLFVLREFEVPHAFVDSNRPFTSVTIIELKRPMRQQGYKTADDEQDPIWQVWRYVKRIRDGKVKDRTGQFIRVNDATPFYAFILCSLTPKMEEMAVANQFIETPDGLGYFNFHQQYRVYTELISYDKIINDARNRNQVLFDKLNLPVRR